MNRFRFTTIALAGLLASVAGAASAQETPAGAPAPADPTVFAAAPLDETVLAQATGRENRPTWQSASASSSANVSGNTVGDNSPTGALGVSDQAFQNLSGISMVNMNTGNGSSINAALNVNVSITMAPVPSTPAGM